MKRVMWCLVLLSAGCQETSAPATSAMSTVVVNRRDLGSQAAVVDSVDLVVRRLSGTIAASAGAALPRTSDTVAVSIPLVLLSDTESFALMLSAIGQGAVLFSDSIMFTAQRGAETPTAVFMAAPRRWTTASVSPSPGGRTAAAMVHAPGLGGVILSGGEGAGGRLGDAWLFDGVSWEPLPAMPNPREGHVMAYIPTTNTVMVFGGTEGGTADFRLPLYVFDGTTWTTPVSVPNSVRDAAMVFDETREEVILFGGSGLGRLWRDTYRWAAGFWRLEAAAGPAARIGHALVYDRDRELVIMVGGMDADSIELNDMWTWDGEAWTQEDGPEAALARHGHTATYDGARHTLVVTGGRRGSTLLDDTWELRNGVWSQVVTPERPPGRTGAVFSYMTSDSIGVLFGGSGVAGLLGDLWIYR